MSIVFLKHSQAGEFIESISASSAIDKFKTLDSRPSDLLDQFQCLHVTGPTLPTMSKSFTKKEVAEHKTEDSGIYIIVDDGVYDVTSKSYCWAILCA